MAGLPATWDIKTNENIRWKAELGSTSYGNPVVADGKVFVGTNNAVPRNPQVTGDKGVLMCFREKDGAFLWQAISDKLEAGKSLDWPEQGVCSSPAVAGKRLYYVTNRGELVCLDTEGFADGANEGPFQAETAKGPNDADVVWKLDMIKELGVSPRNMSNSSPLVWEDLVFVETSNGRHDEEGKVLAPRAPSFLAVNRQTGKVVWQDNSPGDRILHGQWSSPALGEVNGVAQAGDQNQTSGVGDADDVHFILPHTDRFNDNDILAGSIEHLHHISSGLGQSAEKTARGHAANENARVGAETAHAHPVAEYCSSGKGAGRVHGHYAYGQALVTQSMGQLVGERALAGAGRSRNADHIGFAGVGIELFHARIGAIVFVFQPGDQAGHRPR